MSEDSSGDGGASRLGPMLQTDHTVASSGDQVIGNENVFVKGLEGSNIMVTIVNKHQSGKCYIVHSTTEKRDDHLPQGDEAVADVHFNVHINRVCERMDDDDQLLKRLKMFCLSSDENIFGVPEELLEPIHSGKSFISLLKKCRLVSPLNVFYLQILLLKANEEGSQCLDLVEDLKQFALDRGKATLHFQPTQKSLANGVFQTEVKIHGKTTNFANYDVEKLRIVVKEKFGIPEELISINGVEDGSVVLVLQLPKLYREKDILQLWKKEVLQKPVPQWIVENNVMAIHIEKDMEYVKFHRRKEASGSAQSMVSTFAETPQGAQSKLSDEDTDVKSTDEESDDQNDFPFDRPPVPKTRAKRAPNLSGIETEVGKGVIVTFNTIIPPEFKIDKKKYTVAVRMGGAEFGFFQTDCVQMEIKSEPVTGYFHLCGSVVLKCNVLKKPIPYKYIVHYKQLAKSEIWEDLQMKDEKGLVITGQWNRCLQIQPEMCLKGGVWPQYDGILELNKKDRSVFQSVYKGFSSMMSKKSTHVDKQKLVMQTYLPNWKGFVCQSGRDMHPQKALKLLDHVCCCLQNSFLIKGSADLRPRRTHNIQEQLLLCLAPKIVSYVNPSTDYVQAESQLVSGLAITIIIDKYKLQLSEVMMNALWKGLEYPSFSGDSKQQCTELCRDIKEIFSNQKKQIVATLQEQFTNSLQKSPTNSYWLLALTLLHFLRGDSQPFTALERDRKKDAHLMSQWWGMDGIQTTEKNKQITKRIVDLFPYLFPLFKVNPLLPRSVTWLCLSSADFLPSIQNEGIFKKLPTTLLLYAYHIIVTEGNSRESVKKWMLMIGHLLSENYLTSLNPAAVEKVTSVTGRIAKKILESATKLEDHELVVFSCQLYGKCYSIANREAVSNELVCLTNAVVLPLKEWLENCMPEQMTKDGKQLTCPCEFQIWSDLLSLNDQFTSDFLKKTLTTEFTQRISKLDAEIKLTLYQCVNTLYTGKSCAYHPDIEEVLRNAVFESLDELLKIDTKLADGLFIQFFSSLQQSAREKNGGLLSELLCRNWPQEIYRADVLKHILTWSPMLNFMKLKLEKTASHLSALSEEAQERINTAQDILEKTYQYIMDGSITIKEVQLITREAHYQRFIKLYRLNQPEMPAENTAQPTGTNDDLIQVLHYRKKEVDCFHRYQMRYHTLVQMCEKIEYVNLKDLKDTLSTITDEMQLDEFCDCINGDFTRSTPQITYFNQFQAVEDMLQPLYLSKDSVLFEQLLEEQAVKVKQDVDNRDITVQETVELILKPICQVTLRDIFTKVRLETISFADVDRYFSDRVYQVESKLENELKRIAKICDEKTDWITKRTQQIFQYRNLQCQAGVAKQILTMQAAFQLSGDFGTLTTLSEMGEDSFKEQSLSHISDSLINAYKIVELVTNKQLRCLEEAAKATELIKWIRTNIKDVNQLGVFVSMAMTQAGETDMEVDRVSCFHDAAMGYAAIIFDLTPSSNCDDLLKACKKVWNALEIDPDLPAKLRDAKKQIQWLRSAREEHVEETSVSQLEAINSRGIYIIGKRETTHADKKMPPDQYEQPSTVTSLVLKVKASNELSALSVTTKEREYTAEQLQDLQGKINLVVGKKRQARTGGKAQIQLFVEVFTAAQQLAELYDALCKAGCLLFSDLKIILFCGQSPKRKCSVQIDFGVRQSNLLSGNLSLLTEINALRAFLKDCLDDWKSHVDEERTKSYHLNYYTTEQLVLLRQTLASVITDAHVAESLPSQVYTLLSGVSKTCSKQDIQDAVSSVISSSYETPESEPKSSQKESMSILPQTSPEDQAQYNNIISKLEMYDYTRKDATAVIAALGIRQKIKDYRKWLRENPKASTKIASVQLTAKQVQQHMLDDHFDKESPLESQLRKLWEDYLDTMKKCDLEDRLSLTNLGKILAVLADKESPYKRRVFPQELREGEPNLIVRSSGEVLPTLVSIYKEDGHGSLPSFEEVLMCSNRTSYEEVEIFLRRALGDKHGRIFCLVRADQLQYNVSVEAEQKLTLLMKKSTGYRLIVVCSSELDESSIIVTALDSYRNDFHSCSQDEMAQYLYTRFQQEATDLEKVKKMRTQTISKLEETSFLHTASQVTHQRVTVEVVMSSRSGVGKSLHVKRYTEALKSKLIDQGETGLDQEPLCVTVPLHEVYLNDDEVVSALLPHQKCTPDMHPRIFHIDVAPMVQHGLDHFLFTLLVTGGLCDSKGRLWKRNTRDLYVIEVTDTIDVSTSDDNTFESRPFYAQLPRVTCRSPMKIYDDIAPTTSGSDEKDTSPPGTVHRSLVNLRGWQTFDPRIDNKEYVGDTFQKTYQYLQRWENKPEQLDMYQFQNVLSKPITQEDSIQFLETMLKHCGTENPSWAELSNFAKFLTNQMTDCEESIYCDYELTGLTGFKRFVVNFMIHMSRDFATPSLIISEESANYKLDADMQHPKGSEEQQERAVMPVMKRKWESQPHPYIFFNEDKTTMTFFGFVVNDKGELINPLTKGPLEGLQMTSDIKEYLKANKVDLEGPDFDSLKREDKLKRLQRALGVQEGYDPDTTYELTTDNVQKMLAINMKFRCCIPVMVMGETGCGKTRLLRFLCRLKAGPPTGEDEKPVQNMLLMKVHGGTTVSDVIEKINYAERIATENKTRHKLDTILFFDEANTTEAIGVIKEIMCDRRVLGRPTTLADGALKIVAACNPYRRHTPAMIAQLKSAGLGYHIQAKHVRDKLGGIPLRELVYRVHALPPSILPLVWDFGQLSIKVEALYIKQIVQQYTNDDRLDVCPRQAEIITNVLSESQLFMRSQTSECSFVSLRDVERTLQVLSWFQKQLVLKKLLDDKAKSLEYTHPENEEIDHLTRSLVLALGVCYHASLHTSRDKYRKAVAKKFRNPCKLHGGPKRILVEITRCQDIFLEMVELEPFIARNTALKENLFMMLVCIELRIPLFLVGKPGSSKSLAKCIISKVMQGETASTELFRSLKQVHMISYQCGPLSTPEGIVNTFRQGSRFQEKKDLKHFVSVVVLDEVGLAEESPKMPLKSLHPLLETGSSEDEDYIPDHQKVAFIGISNWALDPAKMNRGIAVSRNDPDEDELQKTARGICATDKEALKCIESMIPQLAKAYLTVYKNQTKQYFGLRDFYSLVKMLFTFAKSSSQEEQGDARTPTQAEIEHAVCRNFGGSSGDQDPVKVFRKALKFDSSATSEPETSAQLLKSSLDGRATTHGESRYLLVVTENYKATLPILRQQLLTHYNAIVIYGSSFPFDQEYTQVCQDINKIKRVMETGRTVVLLNMEKLYESLYDALNQYYVYFGGQRYVDLGIGVNRFKCRVAKDFRLIVVADQNVVNDRFPPPLLNRLEKHFLASASMLNADELAVCKKLELWVANAASINMPHKRSKITIEDAFIGYNGDMIPALVFQVSMDLEMHSEGWKDHVYSHVRNLLLQCATPEAILRVSKSFLPSESRAMFQTYFHEQEHKSLQEYLRWKVKTKKENDTNGLMVQVTTHSRLLVRDDFNSLASVLDITKAQLHVMLLQTFQTQHTFAIKIREVFDNCKNEEQILLIQCEAGDENNELIVCASYCINDEKEQALQAVLDAQVTTDTKEMHDRVDKNVTKSIMPVHVVFVIQLPRTHKGFVGFQGGKWDFVHIDDLKPAQERRPIIADLKDRSVGSLLEEHETPVINTTLLMQDSLLDAVSKISDSEQCSDLSMPRFAHLKSLLEQPDTNEERTFIKVIKQRLAELLNEMDNFRGSEGDSWLQTLAVDITEFHKGGTFRRTIWQHLISTVSPLSAELYAFCDCNENMRLLKEYNSSTWQHRLWLAILANSNLSQLHYEDFLSPKDRIMRDRALVKVLGAGDHPFAANIPFSWIIKDYVETKHRNAVQLKTTTEQPVPASLLGEQSKNLPWDLLLSDTTLIPPTAYKHFVKDYMLDFVKMVYRFRSSEEALKEQELKCILRELDMATTETAEKLNIKMDKELMRTLMAIHLAYHRIEGILYNFAGLVDACPSVLKEENRDIFIKQEQDLTLDVKVLNLVVNVLQPDPDTDITRDGHQTWLNQVKAAKPTLDNVIISVVNGLDKEAYSDLSKVKFDDARKLWLKTSLLILFLERVCSATNADGYLFEFAKHLCEDLYLDEPELKATEELEELERILHFGNITVSQAIFGFDAEHLCPVCDKKIRHPEKLPCNHIACGQCLDDYITAFERKCPVKFCKRDIPDGYESDEKRKHMLIKKNVNSFYLDVITQHCFAYNTPPDDNIIQRLLELVTKYSKKDSNIYRSDFIDPDPVTRSVLLQLLLQASRDQIKKSLDEYLSEMQEKLIQRSSAELQEVCLLFIQCIENSLYQEAYKKTNSDVALVQLANKRLKHSREWLIKKTHEEGLSVNYLDVLASARFGIVITAQCLHKVSTKDENALISTGDTFQEAKEFFNYYPACPFLVRQFCHSYGTSAYETLYQQADLDWIAPPDLRDWKEENTKDNFVVCGEPYMTFRKAIADDLQHEVFETTSEAIDKVTVKGLRQEQNYEVAVLLSLYQEVTLLYAKPKAIGLSDKMRDNFLQFVRNNKLLKQSRVMPKFPEDLILNQLGGDARNRYTELEVKPQQQPIEKMIAGLIIHTMAVLRCLKLPHNLHFLQTLFQSPKLTKDWYFPTMPDELQIVEDALGSGSSGVAAWYVCPNGHLYTVGECGKTTQKGRCQDCGAVIGGQYHRPAPGNKVLQLLTQTYKGHILGNISNRSASVVPDSKRLSATATSIVRTILHSTMTASAINNTEVSLLIHPAIPQTDVVDFLWNHLRVDLGQLHTSSGKSQEDCFLILHMVLYNMLTIKPSEQSEHANKKWTDGLKDRDSRKAWELDFSQTYIAPVIQNMNSRLQEAIDLLQEDDRFINNPVTKILYKQDLKEVSKDSMQNLHRLQAVWQFMPRITIRGVQQYLEQQDTASVIAPTDKGPFAVLRTFLSNEPILNLVRHLPDIIELHMLLIDRFNRKVDSSEAAKMTIQDFLDKNMFDDHYQNIMERLVSVFLEAWNSARTYIKDNGALQVPAELCSKELDNSASLATLLPTQHPPGICSSSLAGFLIRTHNEFMLKYERIKDLDIEQGKVSMKPCDATQTHLVAFHPEQELLPLVLANSKYTTEADKGTELTYDLEGIQKQVEDRFIRGRPTLELKIEQLTFRQDSRSAETFRRIRNKIPQESIALPLQKRILQDFKSYPDLCDCVDTLDIAIGFVESTNCPGTMLLKEYLQKELSLAGGGGLQNSLKAQEKCHLSHILALWHLLAVERAKRMVEFGQNPFEGISSDFCKLLSDFPDDENVDNLEHLLYDALKHLKVEQFVAELYEYIVLELKGSTFDIPNMKMWSLKDPLLSYIDAKKGEEVRGLTNHFPAEIQNQHAVETWMASAKYLTAQPVQKGRRKIVSDL